MSNKVSHDSETLAKDQQVITVCALIHHNFDGVEKVLLPKRAATKKFLPNLYELPGGHIDFGEDIVDGLKREIKEELGMTISVGDPFAAYTYKNEIKGSHSAEVIYFAQFIEPLDRISIHPEDHSRYDWFTKEEVITHRSEIIADDDGVTYTEGTNDPEYEAILRGFDLLKGKDLNFG